MTKKGCIIGRRGLFNRRMLLGVGFKVDGGGGGWWWMVVVVVGGVILNRGDSWNVKETESQTIPVFFCIWLL